jgi:hypothetical protein
MAVRDLPAVLMHAPRFPGADITWVAAERRLGAESSGWRVRCWKMDLLVSYEIAEPSRVAQRVYVAGTWLNPRVKHQ